MVSIRFRREVFTNAVIGKAFGKLVKFQSALDAKYSPTMNSLFIQNGGDVFQSALDAKYSPTR